MKIGIPISLVFAYWGLNLYYSGLGIAHLVVGGLTLALSLAPKGTQKWKNLLLPLLFTTIAYDSQRHYSDYLRGPIHVLEPYAFDLRYFGILHDGVLLTPNEWWQQHTNAFLDFFCGISYLIFIPEFFLVAYYFTFHLKERESRIARTMTWGFLWLNLIGFSTYYWYAAAPPWYVSAHGLVPADLQEKANIAGCARFDDLIGLPVFKTWYGNSADVFGSIPSLHVAYPFLAFIYSLRVKRLRLWSLFFFLLVSFSAVYLNHHYILDILWGTTYALLVGLLFWGPKDASPQDRCGIMLPATQRDSE